MARMLPNGRQMETVSPYRFALAKNLRENAFSNHSFSTPAPKVTLNANLRGANLIRHDNNRASVLSGIAEATGVPGANRAYSSFLGGPPVESNWDYVDAATLPLSILAEAAAIPADIATGSPLPSAGVTAGLIGLRQLARRGIPAGFKAIDPGIGLARKVPSFIGKNWNRTGDVAEGYVKNALDAIPKFDNFDGFAHALAGGGVAGKGVARLGPGASGFARTGLAGARSGLAAHKITMMQEHDNPYFQGETEIFNPELERQISGINTPRQPKDKPWVDVSGEISVSPAGTRPGPRFRLGRKVEGKWRQPTIINNTGEHGLPNLGPDEVRSLLFGGRGGIIDIPGKDNPLNNMDDIMRAAQGTVSGIPIPMDQFRLIYEVPNASEIKRMMEGADAGARTRRMDKRKKLFEDVKTKLASGEIDSNQAIRMNNEIDKNHPEWVKNEYSMSDARKLRNRWIAASQAYEKTHGVPLPWKVEGRVGDTWQSVFTQAVEHGKPVDKGGKGTLDELTIIPDLTNSSRSSSPWADWSAKHPTEWQSFIKSLYGKTKVY